MSACLSVCTQPIGCNVSFLADIQGKQLVFFMKIYILFSFPSFDLTIKKLFYNFLVSRSEGITLSDGICFLFGICYLR